MLSSGDGLQPVSKEIQDSITARGVKAHLATAFDPFPLEASSGRPLWEAEGGAVMQDFLKYHRQVELWSDP